MDLCERMFVVLTDDVIKLDRSNNYLPHWKFSFEFNKIYHWKPYHKSHKANEQ